MDEVAENSDALMERYLEGEESPRGDRRRAEGRDQPRPYLPRDVWTGAISEQAVREAELTWA